MIFDKPEDKTILLQIIQNTNIPGNAILAVADLVTRIQAAAIASESKVAMDPLS